MFSIIIPLYNKEYNVAKAIQSVHSQTFEDWELIIINDGSSDRSLEIARGATENIRQPVTILDQVNSGVSATRNRGVSFAQYEFITFLDADDWWAPEFLEKMNHLVHKFPDAGIYGCKYFWVKNGLLTKSLNQEPEDFEGYIDYFKAYTHAWWMPLSSISVVIPKNVFNDMGGFKKELKFGEDFDLWIRIVLIYRVGYLNEPLAFYNQDLYSGHRALGQRMWKKNEHFIFNLNFLVDEERRNQALKVLLDGLRVRVLQSFYLQNKFELEVQAILTRVDFTKQPIYYRFLYLAPKPLVKVFMNVKLYGSIVKQILYKTRHFG